MKSGPPLTLWTLVLLANFLTTEASNTTLSSVSFPMDAVNDANEACAQTACPQRVFLMVEPSPFTYVCGYAARFQEMLRHVQRNSGVTFAQIITTDAVAPAEDRPAQAFGCNVTHVHGFRLPMYPSVTVASDYSFLGWRSLRRFRPTVIHASSPGTMVFGAVLYSRLASVPLVLSYHTHIPVYASSYVSNRFLSSLLSRLAWWCVRAVHAFADLTLVTSPQVKEEFDRHEIHRVDVWQKGIDATRFHPKHRSESFRREVFRATGSDERVLLYVGRLASEKRLEDLVPVMEKLPSNYRLCLVGDGPQRDQLERSFRPLGGAGRVLFLGTLRGEELSAAYASADAFAFPSDSETLGFVVMEAMASGLPVVAARAGGIPNMVTHGVTGYLVTPGDVEGYVRGIQDVEKQRGEIVENARKATEAWTWEASMHNLFSSQYAQAKLNYERRWRVRLWRKIFTRPQYPTVSSGFKNEQDRT